MSQSSSDPAFLFYPGDYLRDTHCLSESSQVAYDRIMCEHMRNTSKDMSNIGVSQTRLDFFTKRLSDDQKSELLSVLNKTNTGYQIEWVARSIVKRVEYSESRSKNRSKNSSKTTTNISQSYVPHMENENGNVIEDIDNTKGEVKEGGKKVRIIPTLDEFMQYSLSLISKSGLKPDGYKFPIEQKYEAWLVAGWKDGYGKEIKNWKTKVGNTITHLKPVSTTPVYSIGTDSKISQLQSVHDNLKQKFEDEHRDSQGKQTA